jgi:hypothetical protein
MKTLSYLNKPIFSYIFLLIITLLVYWPGLSGDFLFDDFPNIVTNSAIHAETLNLDTLQRAAKAYEPGTLIGRPLATISFAIDYSLGGKNPWGYKLVSLLVHLINVLLIFTLTRRLLALPRAGAPWSTAAAFTIAVLWAVHPLQVSAVLYIVQRMETLALTFVLLALLAYLHGRLRQQNSKRGWPWLVASMVLAGIGFLSKETAILFAAYTLALELTVLNFDAESRRTTGTLQWIYGIGVVLALALFTFLIFPKYADPTVYSIRDFTLDERLLSQLRILSMYLGWMLLPRPNSLTFYYDDYPISHGWLDPATTLISGLFLLGLITTAWLMRKRMPLFALGIFWFFAAHLLTSTVFPLELVYEHRNYFALFGILLALADLVRRIPLNDHPALKPVVIGAIVVIFAFLTVIRSATWGDPFLLATDLVARNPLSTRASSDLATLYVGMSGSNPDSPFFSMGQQEFERASRLPNASPLPEQGLILMAATTGQPIKEEWWDRLIDKLKTQPIGTQESLAVAGLLKQRYAGIELSDARLAEIYGTILSRGPQPPVYYIEYANFVLHYLDDPQLASRLFAEAIERNPRDVTYALRIAQSLLEDGHNEQALAVIDKAQALGMADLNQQFTVLREQMLREINP